MISPAVTSEECCSINFTLAQPVTGDQALTLLTLLVRPFE